MTAPKALHLFFTQAASQFPDRVAVVQPGEEQISYSDLDHLSDRVRDRLQALGVQPGDRVGLYLHKSIAGVATILGTLKAGAAYVPVDPDAPARRNAFIMHNCAVKVVVLERNLEVQFREAFGALGGQSVILALDTEAAGTDALQNALDATDATSAATKATNFDPSSEDLAYILYTSGSTGTPKGVALSHGNAVSFINWCSDLFQPRESDRFSSHAPFHFDLSILDIYLALKHGCALILINEQHGKDPVRLAQIIAEQEITCWYSAPSILALLAQYGNLDQHDYAALRLVLFAGEVFAVKHLRTLTKSLPKPRYFNLYGPTETNVCTFYEVIPPVPEDRNKPYPIGSVCSHLRGKVVDENGALVQKGDEGELCITGPSVMQGYWGMPDQTDRAFLSDDDGSWYKTGDIVIEAHDSVYTYVGRRDRMVKRRGYRIELGEIEAGLYRHKAIREAAVVAIEDTETGIRIRAFLSCRDAKHPSLIEMKRFCSENLPLYMIPDEFRWCEALPKTSTDKIDYQKLKETD